MAKAVAPKKPVNVAEVSAELQALQRQRAVVIKSRIMQENRLVAVVAGALDYRSDLSEKERLAKFDEARDLVKRVRKGKAEHDMRSIILVTSVGIDAFKDEQNKIEKAMLAEAKRLPVAKWVERKEQRGFGLLSLAVVVGEAGNLTNYGNPAKLWKRMGCAPYSFEGRTQMGATWKVGKGGGLPPTEWTKFGYSPRRRSISYLLGEGLLKQNMTSKDGVVTWLGPYRARYDETKARAQQSHPDWTPRRCHLHGMLLATKLLLKNLWIEWNGHPPMGQV